MKLKGPFSVGGNLDLPCVLDGAGRHLVRLQWQSSKRNNMDTMKRIAAALNAAEAEESRRRELDKAESRLIARLKDHYSKRRTTGRSAKR